jgi:hypothetical protein
MQVNQTGITQVYKDALERLVQQIALCKPVDEHGHDFRMNAAYVEAKELLGHDKEQML